MNGRAAGPVPRTLGAGAIVAVLAALVAGWGVSPAAGRAQDAALRSGTGCHLPHAAGDVTVSLTVDGRERPFLLHVPTGYDGRQELPLALNLHGSGSNGQQQMEISQMGAAADRRGFAVAAPDGAVDQGNGTHAWNVPGVPLANGSSVPPGTPSDEHYLLALIKRLKQTICIDPDRISIDGFSGGGRMASQMACDFPAKFAALAAVDALRAGVPREVSPDVWKPDKSSCSPREQVPVRTFHGTADTTNPYGGNDAPHWGYGVETALARWAKLDRCKKGPRTTAVTATVDLVSFAKCQPGAKVELYRAEGGGHTWPGSSPGPEVDDSISATDLILKFFKRASLADRAGD